MNSEKVFYRECNVTLRENEIKQQAIKQFAERLKAKAEYDYLANYDTNDEPFIEKPDFLRIVDEALKEFINERD